MMILYRISHKRFSQLNASGTEGRWNTEGSKVIYTAGSIALAFLESMIRRKGLGVHDDFCIMAIRTPDSETLEEILPKNLPAGWRNPADYSACQAIGDRWYNEGKTLLLKVPSSILPQEHNFVINTLHSDYSHIEVVAKTDLIADESLEELLKQKGK